MRSIFFFSLSLLLIACQSSHDGLIEVTLSSDDRSATLWVEIADDPSEQSLGLMHRTELPEDQGMLFVFPESQPLSFWMKNTLIPLDVLFFDASGKFVSVQTMDPCKADPCRGYPSGGIAKFALEVPAGFAAREGVREGWTLRDASSL